jgi:hypothetical protein
MMKVTVARWSGAQCFTVCSKFGVYFSLKRSARV